MTHRPWRRLALLATACVTVAAVGTGVAAAATTSEQPAQAPAAPKPTIVLVHGAFADSSSWNADITALQHLGYPVVAIANPLRSLNGDSDYVRAILQTISGPIVLVGHSYGGAIIGNAARGVANVKSLVFVAAFLLDEGESLATALDPAQFPGGEIGPDTTIARPIPPGGPTDVDISIKPENFRSAFAADVNAEKAAQMAVTQRPLALPAQLQPSGAPAWKTIPSWALITLNDHAIPPAGQRFMAERAGATIRTVPSSHAVMVSHPLAVLGIIVAAAA